MPYGSSRKRGYTTRRRSAPKRARKSLGLNARKGFSKSLVSKTNKKPYGSNMGNAQHIDRPLTGLRSFVPNRLYVKLRYCDNFALQADNLTGLTGSEVPYRLNSLFDPYFLAGGHQPLGFDQLTPMYSRYKVFKVDIQVAVKGKAGSALSYVACNIRNGASVYQLGGLKAIAEILEQPGNTVMDGGLLQSWNQTVWLHEVEGRTYEEYMAEDTYGARVTTDPTITPYLGLACGTADTPASSSNSVYVTVGLVFHAFFYEPNPLSQS